MSRVVLVAGCLLILLGGSAPPAASEAIVADHRGVAQFGSIPASVVRQIRAEYRFFYGHTSHGSQIMTGLDLLAAQDTLYTRPAFQEYGDDLGGLGDTTWVAPTRAYLDAHPACNAVMWSWCGGCSDNTEEGINIYLNAMDRLEQQYPHVLFVYMTGHLDGTGPLGNLYARNNQIRGYCQAHDKVLFDFADIESYDPDGTYYPYESDACQWCTTWCASHPCPSCDCAHSHCFNCQLKGKGFWWMMARVSGWGTTGAPLAGGQGGAATLRLEQNYPNPFNPETEIRFGLPTACRARLEVFSAAGQRVALLLDRDLDSGDHVCQWNSQDSRGRPLAPGTYFLRLTAGESSVTKKMALVR